LHRVVFYADAKFVSLPVGLTFQEMKSFLKMNHAQYLIVDKRTIDELLNGFQANFDSLFLEKVSLPELETYKEYSINVYRVKG
jgi:phage terminase large subunit